MKVFLVGFMGSGKSFVGKRLAEKLNLDFVDLDDWIESKEAKTISEIFQESGESHFRKLELFHLFNFADKENVVIATGGGTACFFDNMEWMNRKGITIFLNPTLDILFKRLKKEMTHRPLLMDQSDETLRAYISQKLENRLKYYEKSLITITITTLEQDVVQDILEQLDIIQ